MAIQRRVEVERTRIVPQAISGRKTAKIFDTLSPSQICCRALQEWIAVYKAKVVVWTQIVALFRDICDLESPTYKNDLDKKIRKIIAFVDEQIIDYYPALEQIALVYLNRPVVPAGQSLSKTWPVKQVFLPNVYGTYKGDEQDKAELRYQVSEALYPPNGEESA